MTIASGCNKGSPSLEESASNYAGHQHKPDVSKALVDAELLELVGDEHAVDQVDEERNPAVPNGLDGTLTLHQSQDQHSKGKRGSRQRLQHHAVHFCAARDTPRLCSCFGHGEQEEAVEQLEHCNELHEVCCRARVEASVHYGARQGQVEVLSAYSTASLLWIVVEEAFDRHDKGWNQAPSYCMCNRSFCCEGEEACEHDPKQEHSIGLNQPLTQKRKRTQSIHLFLPWWGPGQTLQNSNYQAQWQSWLRAWGQHRPARP
mmetsp:Transcript_34104/g.70436  ORF Transcript_34104/g.70436 Transcript_34104/m.70436 type:complete len:260 (+) Transcript_34104:42-821(+)